MGQTMKLSGSLPWNIELVQKDYPLTADEVKDIAMDDSVFLSLWNGDITGYPSPSEADLAMADKCVYYFDSIGGRSLVEKYMNDSHLKRDKWDTKRRDSSDGTLLGRAIDRAYCDTVDRFEPVRTEWEAYLPDGEAADWGELTTGEKRIPVNLKTITTKGGLVTYSANALAEADPPPPEFIIEGFLPVGLSMLAAAPKVGKSWLCLDWCLSISRGLPWFQFATKQSRVLYLALEDTPSRLNSRMKKLLQGEKQPDLLFFGNISETLQGNLLEQLGGFIEEYPDTKVIIVDTFQWIRAEPSKKQDTYGTDYKELNQLKVFADSHGIALIIIHHTNKKTDVSEELDKVSGSQAMRGGVDATFLITKNRRTGDGELEVSGRDFGDYVYTIRFNSDTCRWDLIGNSKDIRKVKEREDYENNPIVKTVLQLVGDNAGEWCGTSSEFLIQYSEIIGEPSELTPQQISVQFRKLEYQLKTFSSIQHEKGTRKHTFKKASKYKSGNGTMQKSSYALMKEVDQSTEERMTEITEALERGEMVDIFPHP